MKALFCHDHQYYRDGRIILSRGQYHSSVWSRYLNHFDALTIIGRDGGKAKSNETGINRSSRNNIHFVLFPNLNSLKSKILGNTKTQSHIQALVSDHDVIILRGTSEIGSLAFQAAAQQGKFIAIEVVSCAFDELWFYGSLKARLYAPYRFMKQRQLTRQADAVIYVSQEFLQKRYPSKASLIAQASNVQIPESAFYQKQATKKTTYRVGMIGTLKNHLKGAHIAIDAMGLLTSKHTVLHILGPGDPEPYQKIIDKKGLSDRVKLEGIRETGEAVWQWLREMDVYIQPSFQEGVPRATIEAMSQGLPVIGSNAGGIPELINDNWVVPRGEAMALANAIQEMVASNDIMRIEGEKNFQTARLYSDEKLSKVRNEFWGTVVVMATERLKCNSKKINE